MIAGIDYGSKMAGTTVIAFEQNDKIELICSKKNQDADQMILDFVAAYKPSLIGLDAPLSLPGVYTDPENYSDYFYRACDKEAKAMSPMFLGGLTARAIKLRSSIEDSVKMIEVYPAMKAKELKLSEFAYKKKEADYIRMLDRVIGSLEKMSIQNSHQFDAILALQIVKSYNQGGTRGVGQAEEGIIYY